MTDALGRLDRPSPMGATPPAPPRIDPNAPAAGAVSRPLPGPAGMPRFYMTSDLRAATGLPRTHLDFYLREGLIRPTARTESGYLLFDEDELATLRAIIAWRRGGLAIREIRQRLGR